MKLVNITAALASLMFLASCGSDPEIDAVVEHFVATEGWSKSDAKCYAKAVRKGVTDEQWILFQKQSGLLEEVEETDPSAIMENAFEGMGEMMAMLPIIMGAGIKCGIPMDK